MLEVEFLIAGPLVDVMKFESSGSKTGSIFKNSLSVMDGLEGAGRGVFAVGLSGVAREGSFPLPLSFILPSSNCFDLIVSALCLGRKKHIYRTVPQNNVAMMTAMDENIKIVDRLIELFTVDVTVGCGMLYIPREFVADITFLKKLIR
jgi:hypothetical protein